MKATLYTDGGARGNPGPAGIGAVLEIDGQLAGTVSEYIGEATNNKAEYKALIAGLRMAHELGATHLSCFLDSELVVKQLRGEYRVKDKDLKTLHSAVTSLTTKFVTITFQHVPREKNKKADKLVNQAIDSQIK